MNNQDKLNVFILFVQTRGFGVYFLVIEFSLIFAFLYAAFFATIAPFALREALKEHLKHKNLGL